MLVEFSVEEVDVADVVGGLAMGIAIAAACATVYEIARFKGSESLKADASTTLTP